MQPRKPWPRLRRPVLAAVLMLLGACNTATVYRGSQPAIEGQIVASDRRNLYLTNAAGQTFAVPRDDTVIDHPGNVLALVGGIGLLSVASVVNEPQFRNTPEGLLPQAATYLALTAYGLYVWFSSRTAADGFGETPAVSNAAKAAPLEEVR